MTGRCRAPARALKGAIARLFTRHKLLMRCWTGAAVTTCSPHLHKSSGACPRTWPLIANT